MELIRTTALVIRSIEFGEKNRIITLYSADHGKMTVTCKGCNSPKSKLLPATEPGVFAEYELTVSSASKYILTGYRSIDMFFELSADVDKFYALSVMLELFDKTVPENTLDNSFFAYLIRSMSRLKTSVCPAFDIVKYYLYMMENNGVEFRLDDRCALCGKEVAGLDYSFTDQGFICKNCLTKGGRIRSVVRFSEREGELLRLMASQNEEDGADSIYNAESKLIAKKLDEIFSGIVGVNSTSLAQYLRL